MRKLLTLLLLLTSFAALAQVPSGLDTTRTGTVLLPSPQFYYITDMYGRRYYLSNSALAKNDFIISSKYLRAYYPAFTDIYTRTAADARYWRLTGGNSWSGNQAGSSGDITTANGKFGSQDVGTGRIGYHLGTRLYDSGTPGNYFDAYVSGNAVVKSDASIVLSSYLSGTQRDVTFTGGRITSHGDTVLYSNSPINIGANQIQAQRFYSYTTGAAGTIIDPAYIQLGNGSNTTEIQPASISNYTSLNSLKQRILFNQAVGGNVDFQLNGAKVPGTYTLATLDDITGSGGLAYTKAQTDSIAALKLSKTDTAAMLANYIPKFVNSTVPSIKRFSLQSGTLPTLTSEIVTDFTNVNGTRTGLGINAFGTAIYPYVLGRSAGGTLASPTAKLSAVPLWQQRVIGYGTSAWSSEFTWLQVAPTQDWTNTANGYDIRLYTNADGASTQQEVLKLGQDRLATFSGNILGNLNGNILGRFAIGTSATPGANLQISTTSFTTSNALSNNAFGINQVAYTVSSTAGGATIAAASGNNLGVVTWNNANATTVTDGYGNMFNAPTAGTNTTITNRYAALFTANTKTVGTSILTNVASGTAGTDSVVVHNGTDNRLYKISAAYYAPTASPTFTGTATAPNLILSAIPTYSTGGFTNVSVNNTTGRLEKTTALTPVISASTSQAFNANTRYIPTSASLVTLTLPSTAAVGDVFIITGYGSGLWKIAQNSGQVIHAATDTTIGTGGSLTATGRYNSIQIVCVVANTDFVVQSSQGSITII